MKLIFRISQPISFVLLFVCIRYAASLMASSSIFNKEDNYDDENEKFKTFSNDSMDNSMGRSKLF